MSVAFSLSKRKHNCNLIGGKLHIFFYKGKNGTLPKN